MHEFVFTKHILCPKNPPTMSWKDRFPCTAVKVQDGEPVNHFVTDLYNLPDNKATLTYKKKFLYNRNMQTITNPTLNRMRKLINYPTTCYGTIFHRYGLHRSWKSTLWRKYHKSDLNSHIHPIIHLPEPNQSDITMKISMKVGWVWGGGGVTGCSQRKTPLGVWR